MSASAIRPDRAAPARRPRVFSGIQPSGDMHLGNYLGAVKPWVDGQRAKENYFCLVDLHALTVPQDPDDLRRQTRALAAFLLAAGLDPGQCTLFVQSQVPAHAEASWLLNCVTPLGWLQRMTQYKDRAGRHESVSTGLLDYPVLMAADILLYDADEVPVGEDQTQHVELARDVAERFNRLYGELFVVPAAGIPSAGARVMGLDDPTVKMSKSHAHVPGHAIRILDEPEVIRRTILQAVTDSGNEIRFSDEPARAGVTNLLGMLVSAMEVHEVYKVIRQTSRKSGRWRRWPRCVERPSRPWTSRWRSRRPISRSPTASRWRPPSSTRRPAAMARRSSPATRTSRASRTRSSCGRRGRPFRGPPSRAQGLAASRRRPRRVANSRVWPDRAA